ncbi:MAG TPA: hypothetical protein VK997_11190 [Deferrisomatales bacterium]|nr:hypothetical protein [Deferrisomatales bacterium]
MKTGFPSPEEKERPPNRRGIFGHGGEALIGGSWTRILVVEDNPQVLGFVSRGLEVALHPAYDAAVVDILLTGRDGLSLIEQMPAQCVRTPGLILSALHSMIERVEGLRQVGETTI